MSMFKRTRSGADSGPRRGRPRARGRSDAPLPPGPSDRHPQGRSDVSTTAPGPADDDGALLSADDGSAPSSAAADPSDLATGSESIVGPPSPFLQHPDDFARLVERYQKLLFKYVYNIFRDYHLAQDLSQEIFLKVYSSMANYNVKYPFSTWLLRVAHNYSIDHLRKRKLQLVSLETKLGDTRVADSLWASLPAASREYERSVERDTIKEAIFALHSDYRSVIFLRYIEGVKLEDIAYILGIPLGTVKSRINRARLLLQRRLKDMDLR